MIDRSHPILISGASGLVGSELVRHLRQQGAKVATLVRRGAIDAYEIRWAQPFSFPPGFVASAIVHLAGEPVVGIWTKEKKRRIYESRVNRTRDLCEAIAHQEQKPRVLVSASAIGYYGERGDEILTESSHSGKGFLAETAVDWERATEPARAAGVRVVNLRISVVLSKNGGALAAMLPAFRLGLGSRLGNGKHWISWITLEDLVRVILLALERDDIQGPVNAAAPNPVTNAEFAKTLASVLHRPTFLPVPSFLVRLAPGGMAEEALLVSERVSPEKLLQTGFQFEHPDFRSALEAVLRK